MNRLPATLLSGLRTANHWLLAQFAKAALSLLRRLPPDGALDIADRAARRLGPLVGRHQVALDNLRKAFPEKSDAEIEAIASDMWGHMARLAAEYVFLDRLFDYVPGQAVDGPHRGLRRADLPAGLRGRPTGRTSSSPRISAISSCCRWPAPSSAWT